MIAGVGASVFLAQSRRVGTTDVGIICGMPAVTRGSPET
jgi:hypothetical protein